MHKPFALTTAALLLGGALVAQPRAAEPCGDATVASTSTPFDKERVWLHEPGWFTPLDDPKIVKASDESYRASAPLMLVAAGGETRAYPVEAMAYHHVSNDVIGGVPIAVTY